MENCYFDVLGILIHNISSEVIAGESLQSNGAKYLVDFKLDGKFEGLLIYHNYIAPLQFALPLLQSFTHSGNTKFIIVTQDYFYYGESEDDKLKVQVPRQHEEEYIFLFTNQ